MELKRLTCAISRYDARIAQNAKKSMSLSPTEDSVRSVYEFVYEVVKCFYVREEDYG